MGDGATPSPIALRRSFQCRLKEPWASWGHLAPVAWLPTRSQAKTPRSARPSQQGNSPAHSEHKAPARGASIPSKPQSHEAANQPLRRSGSPAAPSQESCERPKRGAAPRDPEPGGNSGRAGPSAPPPGHARRAPRPRARGTLARPPTPPSALRKARAKNDD